MSRARPGFTLIELVTAMTLLGLIFAIALPNVRKAAGRANLKSARETVASLATEARRAAIARSKATRLVAIGDSVAILLDDNTVIGGANLAKQWGATLSVYYNKGEGALPNNEVRFDKHGLARAAVPQARVFKVTAADKSDSVCISGAGMVMRGACR